jgi:hypothetical protein
MILFYSCLSVSGFELDLLKFEFTDFLFSLRLAILNEQLLWAYYIFFINGYLEKITLKFVMLCL